MSALTKKLGQYGLIGLITLGCAEIASCVGGGIMKKRGILYDPPETTSLVSYLAKRDPELGWPNPKKLGQGDWDAAGSRKVPAFPDPKVTPCASIYGDSFAWAEEVDDEHAWGNVLSRRMGCRVANYGITGFGPDQAYLRYARSKDDRSKVVILTHLSENILRNVNRLRNLIAPSSEPALKPRFVANASGEIELVPIYTPKDEADLRAVVDHPEDHLQNEWFAPGGAAGVSRLGFPYLLSVKRALGSFKMRAAFAGRPSHEEFYAPDHPARGLQVSVGIAKAFTREATSRGASPLFVIIPLVPDFVGKKKTGKWSYAPLVDELERAKVPYLDTGARFEAELQGGDPCSLYVRCSGGHFNEKGYRLLGEYVHEWLKTNGKI